MEDILQEKIRRGHAVFDRRLRIYESPDGFNYGRQLYLPDVGRLDLLAVDEVTNDLVVIELNRHKDAGDVVDQTKRYVQWVSSSLATSGQRVCAIICLQNASDDLTRLAESADIELFEYDLSFVRTR